MTPSNDETILQYDSEEKVVNNGNGYRHQNYTTSPDSSKDQ